MSKLVVLELGEGDLQQQGFPVRLRIMEDGKPAEISITGKLPPNPQVEESYVLWRSRYKHYLRSGSATRLDDEKNQITNIGECDRPLNPIDDCKEAGQVLIDALNDWLKSSSFISIREKFLRKIRTDEEIKIIVQTDNFLFRKLPWSKWELLAEYKNAEIAFSPRNYEPPKVGNIKKKRKIQVLAILGDSADINIEKDRQILKRELPDAKIEFLEKPTRTQINDKLQEESWDILFFAGHSESKSNFNRGLIKINETDSLNLKDLRDTLSKAIAKGLSLAIFNSCDGLGLAAELSTMQIPQMIVMQEPIPDVVAHKFLKCFLKAFARTHSLYLAVREARKSLQILENGLGKDVDLQNQQFPCASWLPVIFQNPAYQPLSWVPYRYTPTLRSLIATSLAVASLVLGVRHLGLLQSLELKAYDQMMQLRPDEGIDPRILVIKVDKRDIDAQDNKEKGEFSLSNANLVKVINELNEHQPRVIGLDMYRDFSPLSKVKPTADLKKLFESENLLATCEVENPERVSGSVGTPPPPFISTERLGFSDVAFDSATPGSGIKIIRRHLLFMNPKSSSRCQAHNSLSWQLAEYYLDTEKNISPKQISKTELKLEKAHFQQLPSHAGGYQHLDNGGFQILLNYRNRNPEKFAKSFSVTELLTGYVPHSDIKDKIILVGVTDPPVPDDFQTPYGTPIRGVFLHAQMVSQIISAALGERPLLGVWSWWGDGLWICGWSFVGGLIIWRIRDAIPLGVGITLAIVILYGSCFLLFVKGYWVPFVPSLLTLAGSSAILICYSLYKKSTINQ
ncbi:CHASE2 domain-containing protein [Calothrix sp. UHCC 0171]|uniref:CHASE2 domain-containing protein n=1 Tax=Calothrix sp. UHCC 0171 TaxID=3110245 RepID=UPI002B21E660|nr:CHASE2 domain-containing protein [Calothrix sp. UHCC 0171]MEA5573479.1 CHASE2 domain-containing protein [Calothrix sp. UHCC 0171]